MARIAAHIGWGLVLIALHVPRLAAAERHRVVQRWSAQVLEVLGVQTRAGGLTCARGLLVANHVSWLDVIVLLAVVPHARFVCKAEVASWPVIGRLVAGAGTIFIERGDARALKQVVDEIAETLATDGLVAVFPEGTTSDGRDVLPFRPGLVEAAIRTGAPVLPVALRYDSAAGTPAPEPVYIGETSFAESLWRIAAAPTLGVELGRLPAMAASGAERRGLAEAARQSIRSALAAMHEGRAGTP